VPAKCAVFAKSRHWRVIHGRCRWAWRATGNVGSEPELKEEAAHSAFRKFIASCFLGLFSVLKIGAINSSETSVKF
jgi:hypothetical protein